VEKRKPHYDLASIKATFTTAATLRMTKTAQDCSLGLGLLSQDVVNLIQKMTREQFLQIDVEQSEHRCVAGCVSRSLGRHRALH
jgi:hypothetical protein